MQLVHPPHHGEISGWDWARQVVDTASADPKRLGLGGDGEIVTSIDHRFALRRPALAQARRTKNR